MIDAADILKASILIVDDQAANVSLLEKLLRGAGYVSITSTTDPRAVCELHRQHRYSLILLDLQMPGLDGFQVMEGLKAIETESYLPVLVITAQPDHKLRALKAGAKDFISKPFDLAEVLMRVRNMLEVRLLHLKMGTRAEQAEMQTELVESQSEQAIRGSELRYRRLFETAPDGILILDADTGQVVDANPFMKDLLGYSQAEFLGKKLWEIGPFKGEAASKITFAELQQKDRIHYEGLPLETKDGRRVEVEFISNAYLVDQKRLIQCNIRDITERKRTAEKASRMATVVRDSNDAITIQDFEGRITAWNRGAERMYGYGEAEALAMNIERLTAPGKVAEQKDFVRRLLAGEAVTSLETQRLTKDGRVLDVWMTVTKLMDEAGKPIGIASTERDITARKRAEESLARLATAVEQSAESVTITDTNAKILYVNPAFEKISGYTRAEVLGQNPRLLKSGKHDAAFYRQMWDVLTRGEVWHGHFINQRQDGKLYEEEATISPIREAEGKVVNYVGVKRDVTHEMQLEEQTRRMQKMEAIGTLAGGVAHDFNNILAVIQMQADLLKAGGNLSPAQFDFAEQIGASVQRAAALTRQLLLFSRKEVLQLHDLDLNQSLSNLSKMLQRILGENIQTQFKFAPHPLFIHADAGMMDQVLMNLVINSRDAMPQGGRLVIETSIAEFDEAAVQQSPQVRPGSFVCLSVSDTGGGIPAEILPRIFEPFFTTKGVGKGTGLGLATVFGIVQQHQGWIHVYSEPGHGTTFRIYLPWLSGTTDQTIAEKLLVVPMLGGHETILLVEDDSFLRVSVCKALTQLGYRLLEAGNGAEALEVWRQHRAEINLMLTDLVMPGDLNGRELAERLLQEKPSLKVIYASGYSAEVAAKNFPLAEGVNFLAKPFQTFKLAQTVRKNLDANLPPVAPA